MTTEKLKALVEEENERREETLVDEARGLIKAIGQARGCIAAQEERIKELQASLRALEIKPIDAVSILGS